MEASLRGAPPGIKPEHLLYDVKRNPKGRACLPSEVASVVAFLASDDAKAINGAEAYAATDLPDDIGRHWREYGRIAAENGEEALHDVFRRWFWVADPGDDLIYDPVP